MNHPGSQQQGKPQQADDMAGQEGRREPVHPDDIGAEGEYLGDESGSTQEGERKGKPPSPPGS